MSGIFFLEFMLELTVLIRKSVEFKVFQSCGLIWLEVGVVRIECSCARSLYSEKKIDCKYTSIMWATLMEQVVIYMQSEFVASRS